MTYSYLDSKLTDSDQESFTFNQGFNSTADDPVDAPAVPLPADYDVTHKIAGTASLRFPADFNQGTTLGSVFENFGVFGTARFQSGLPYSPQPVNSAVFIAPVNSARRNSDFQVDLRATKYFTLASDVELGAIFEVFNVFNNQNFITADAIPFGEVGVTNGVYNTTGGLLTGRELFEANQLVTDPIVLADIDTSTRSGQIQREFRGFMDIDGDGVVAEEEQRIMGLLATGAEFLLPTQPKRNYRLGVELRF